jgi:hypothetical protein
LKIDHWMTFGTFAEQKFFIYPTSDTYKGVIFNGNMAAYAPGGLAAFLAEKTKSLNYIIDPLTHAFQHDPSAVLTKGPDGELKVKSSIRTLADSFGNPIMKIVGKRPLVPKDLDLPIFEEFVENTINFQRNQILNSIEDSGVAKYLDPKENEFKPYALIAPYFYLTETTVNVWLPKLAQSLEIALSKKEAGEKIFGAVVVSQGVILNTSLLQEILKTLISLDVDGFLIWIDNLNENAAGGAELKGLFDLAKGLRVEGSKEVIALHGGYFSVLAGGTLGKGALSGVAHGPEFGEFRSVVPVGGGIPIAKYYIPHLHSRVRYSEAVHYFNNKEWLTSPEKFYSSVCDCLECKSVIKSNIDNFTKFGESTAKMITRKYGSVRIDYPTREAKERCLKHYLNRKKVEFNMAAQVKEEILQDLNYGIEEFKNVAGLEAVSHLQLWQEVLNT